MRVSSRLKMTATLGAILFAATIGLFDYIDTSSRSALEIPRKTGLNEPQRFLRVNEEERWAIDKQAFEQATASVNSFMATLALHWNVWLLKLMRFSATNAFTHLKLDEAGENILSTPKFKIWYKRIKQINKGDPEATMASMAKIMAAHSSDEELLQMLTASRKFTATEELATGLLIARMDSLVDEGISVGNVFKWLKLDTDMDDVTLHVWMKYAENSEAALSAVITAVLAHHPRQVFEKKLSAFSEVPALKDMASRLQIELKEPWVEKRKYAIVWFKWLKLDIQIGIINFEMWSQLMKMNHQRDSQVAAAAMLEIMLAYSSTEVLVKVLEALRTLTATEDMATRVLIALMDSWVDEDKSVKTVFNLLNLDTRINNLKFEVLTEYAEMKYDGDSEAAMSSIITLMLVHYRRLDFEKILEGFSEVPAMKDVASRLQMELEKPWVEMRYLAIWWFKRLELNSRVDAENFKSWTERMEELKVDLAVMLEILLARYSDQEVKKMLEALRKVTATKDIANHLRMSLMDS